MSTYLQLCQRTVEEVSGSGTGPAAVTNQTGELKRIVDWVSTAHMDIVSLHTDWDWLRASFSFATVEAQQGYTPAQAGTTNFARWLTNTFRIYVTAQGFKTEQWMEEWDWETFRNLYVFGAQRTVEARPVIFAVKPDKSINVGPLPNATGYTIVGDYFSSPQPLAADDDTPAFPAEFHMAVVYRAMMKYGRFTGASEVYQDGENNYKRMLAEMERTNLPAFVLGSPLI